jgi:hypothetical protein
MYAIANEATKLRRNLGRAIRFVLCRGLVPSNCHVHRNCIGNVVACQKCQAFYDLKLAAAVLLGNAIEGKLTMANVQEFTSAKENSLMLGSPSAQPNNPRVYMYPVYVIDTVKALSEQILIGENFDKELRNICGSFVQMHIKYRRGNKIEEEFFETGKPIGIEKSVEQRDCFTDSLRLQAFLGSKYQQIEHIEQPNERLFPEGNGLKTTEPVEGESAGPNGLKTTEPVEGESAGPNGLKTTEPPCITTHEQDATMRDAILFANIQRSKCISSGRRFDLLTLGEIREIVSAHMNKNGCIHGADLRGFNKFELKAMLATINRRLSNLFNVPAEEKLQQTKTILQRYIRTQEHACEIEREFGIADVIGIVGPVWTDEGSCIRGNDLSGYTLGELRRMHAVLNRRLAFQRDERVEETLTFAKIIIMRELAWTN